MIAPEISGELPRRFGYLEGLFSLFGAAFLAKWSSTIDGSISRRNIGIFAKQVKGGWRLWTKLMELTASISSRCEACNRRS
jgi:hypothetical protein